LAQKEAQLKQKHSALVKLVSAATKHQQLMVTRQKQTAAIAVAIAQKYKKLQQTQKLTGVASAGMLAKQGKELKIARAVAAAAKEEARKARLQCQRLRKASAHVKARL